VSRPVPVRAAHAVVVMGVSGCGKSTISAALAQRLAWRFLDADDFHPLANVEKMRAGQPLNDQDRWPWLDELNRLLRESVARGEPLVLACSALRQRYRDRLANQLPGLRWVHLDGSFELIAARMAARQHEYMPASLLRSQFESLEPPQAALRVSIDQSPEQIVSTIVGQLD
jgi:gluconokinase